ncbi:MAG TPA: MATE family efflux transporter [Peptococcaceae bacterium]|nr:MAG: MATE efflux family protein [Moorella sp. 60_41]HBT47418.1 MATE family efflux transporter [Peptococcaceae bacterium]
MNQGEQTRELELAPIGRLLWKFALPAITGMLVNALYNVVDRIVVGRGVGKLAIAATTVAFPVMLVLMALSMLVGMGATALISIRLGEKKKEEADLIAGNALTLLVLVAGCASAVGLLFLEPLLLNFGAPESVLPYAVEYTRIILLGNVLMTLGFGLTNMIRAEGHPLLAMVLNVAGALSNIVLDYIAVFPLGLGIKGAAMATVISQGISAAGALYYYLSGRSLVKLRGRNLFLRRSVCLTVFAVGFPYFALQLVHSLQQVIFNKSLAHYGGDLAIAAVGVVFSLGTFMFMPVIGISQAAQPIIGFNYGARKMERVKATLKLASFWATVIIGIGYTATRIWPEQLVALFSRQDAELIAMAAEAMHVLFLVLPVIGFQIVGSGYFQATGKPLQGTLLTLSRQVFLLIPLLLFLPRFWGLPGVWWTMPLSDLGSTLITTAFLYHDFRAEAARARDIPVLGREGS